MSIGRMGESGLCAVFGYHRGRGTGFFQDQAHILVYMEPYFSVYRVILYKCCL